MGDTRDQISQSTLTMPVSMHWMTGHAAEAVGDVKVQSKRKAGVDECISTIRGVARGGQCAVDRGTEETNGPQQHIQ